MTSKSLSSEFINKLIKKADEKLPRTKPIFTEDEHKLIRNSVRLEVPQVHLRGKVFNIRYFTWRKEDWVTIRPVKGFVPMFSMPKKRLLTDRELEI